MASSIILDVKDIDLFKNLVSLLERHFEDLPEQLQNTLKDISENGISGDSGKMKLFINNSNMGECEIVHSNIAYDEFKIKRDDKANYFIERYSCKKCDISLVLEDKIIIYSGFILGGSENSVNIDRQSEKKEYNFK